MRKPGPRRNVPGEPADTLVGGDFQNMSLLVVDDDIPFGQQLAHTLSLREFDVRFAAGLRSGSEMLTADPPKFAVFELKYVDGNGIDLIEALMRRRPDARALVLSCYGSIESVVSAAKFGAIDFLAKPSDVDQILAALMTPGVVLPLPPENSAPPSAVRLAHIQTILQRCNNNISAAARMLGMHRRTLQRIVRRADGEMHDDLGCMSPTS